MSELCCLSPEQLVILASVNDPKKDKDSKND